MTDTATTTDREVADLLEHLAQTAEDGVRGFAQAAEHVDADEIAAVFRQLGTERDEIAKELRLLAASHFGEFVSDGGTLKGAIHRGWISLKDALTGDDPHAVIAAAEEGEDYAVEQWREALEKDLPERIRQVVERQYAQVKAAHDRVRNLELATE